MKCDVTEHANFALVFLCVQQCQVLKTAEALGEEASYKTTLMKS
jgi:hypothetical protein